MRVPPRLWHVGRSSGNAVLALAALSSGAEFPVRPITLPDFRTCKTHMRCHSNVTSAAKLQALHLELPLLLQLQPHPTWQARSTLAKKRNSESKTTPSSTCVLVALQPIRFLARKFPLAYYVIQHPVLRFISQCSDDSSYAFYANCGGALDRPGLSSDFDNLECSA